MKGASNQPTFQNHLELHAALVNVLGVNATVPRRKMNAYLMERTGVGLRQSVNRILEAWEDLGLIQENVWKATRKNPGRIVLLAAPEGLALPAIIYRRQAVEA
jgi:hypothetical protein